MPRPVLFFGMIPRIKFYIVLNKLLKEVLTLDK